MPLEFLARVSPHLFLRSRGGQSVACAHDGPVETECAQAEEEVGEAGRGGFFGGGGAEVRGVGKGAGGGVADGGVGDGEGEAHGGFWYGRVCGGGGIGWGVRTMVVVVVMSWEGDGEGGAMFVMMIQ